MKSLYDFIEDRRNGRVGGTTAIFSKTYKALYFSKEVVPYTGKKFDNDNDVPLYHHVGVYAYKKSALDKYILLNEGNLEKFEGLEQLRFLENDIPVKCVEVQDNGRHFWELNNPEDVKRIESVLQAHKIE
jgi:3-deoxy-manno-octulosonate cytidylyltransferase (CMP-KDO synthetase)